MSSTGNPRHKACTSWLAELSQQELKQLDELFSYRELHLLMQKAQDLQNSFDIMAILSAQRIPQNRWNECAEHLNFILNVIRWEATGPIPSHLPTADGESSSLLLNPSTFFTQ